MFVWVKGNAIKHFKVFRMKRKKEKRWVGVSKPIECALLVGGRESREGGNNSTCSREGGEASR
jgi:hypothetical protein